MSKDTTPLTFGKYKGQTPEAVAEYDPSYIVWMFENVRTAPCSKALANDCKQNVREYEEEKAADLHFGLDGW